MHIIVVVVDRMTIDTSHPYSTGTKHIGFSPTRHGGTGGQGGGIVNSGVLRLLWEWWWCVYA